ncbi:hypothetical protein AMJ71_06785 [candidate division TA06 bacterium SM1_40]|uniref:FlgD/Vpr Ig-like domain-containing protein n=1 Tax=candidate division TA06 bacterium SM1_40 TaxID=1703773 RepID=A0A0S8JHQ0_UNCT6|nr:MAG: hypothetical protein AMJ71_06785 [candidate division TA06 bacterium SM1_40]
MKRQLREEIIMRTLMFVLALLVPLTAGAQIMFEYTYGGADWDGAYSVRQTSDGGYAIAGWTYSFGAGSQDAYLIRTDEWGDPLWWNAYGGPASESCYSLDQTDDGGFVVVGGTTSFGHGGNDIYLVKTDGAGDTVWTRTYGGTDHDGGSSGAQTDDGGYIVAGYTYSFGAGVTDVYVVKTDGDGDTLWTRTYGGSGSDRGSSVAQTADGGYIIAGYTRSFGAGESDVYLIKTDASGDTLWTRAHGGSDQDFGHSVAQTVDGGYIIGGETQSFGAGGWDFYLVRTDGDGDTLWTRTYGGQYYDEGFSVAQTFDGGYIVTGYVEPSASGIGDLYLIKTDASGDTLWTRTYGELEYDEGQAVAQTADGGYIVAGYTESFGVSGSDVYLIKTNAEGLVGVSGEVDEPPRPRSSYLAQNYPNPFRAKTTIRYALPEAGHVTVVLYDIRGARVRSLVSNSVPAGPHELEWDGRDDRGYKVGSGIYFCRMEAGEVNETRRMLLVR